MEKPINNPFAVNPAMNNGGSPDPSIIRPENRLQENRAGVQRVPQRPYAYQGGQRPQGASIPQNAGNRGYRIPAPAGASPARTPVTGSAGTGSAGTASAGASPAAPMQANMPTPAAGYGMPSNNQTVSPDIDSNVSGQNPNRAGGNGKANARSKSQSTGGKKDASNMADGLKLDFTEDNLLRGFVMSEILGRPKCFSRGRW